MALPFQLKISKEQLEGRELVPEGLYKVRFSRFNPKWTNQGNLTDAQWVASRSVNLQAEYEILEHPDYAGRIIYDTLNIGPKTPLFGLQDMCHGFGFIIPQDPTTGQYDVPGMDSIEKNPNYNPDDPTTWDYRGPLLGKVTQLELGHDVWNGKTRERPRRWFCQVQNCAKDYPMIRHSQNLIRTK
jgi:hypothetical protein